MKQSTYANLIAVRKLIKKGWCRGVEARTRWGTPVYYDSPKACSFCLTGAINKICPPLANAHADPAPRPRAHYDVLLVIERHLPVAVPRHVGCHTLDIQLFNDRYARSKKHVIRVIDAAIEECKR